MRRLTQKLIVTSFITFALVSARTTMAAEKSTDEGLLLSETSDNELVDMHYPTATEITAIAKKVSKSLNINFLWDTKIKGKIQIISPNPVPKDVAYELFMSALDTLGLATTKSGKLTKIINQKEVFLHHKIYKNGDTLPNSDKFITAYIPLKFADAKLLSTKFSRIANPKTILVLENNNAFILNGPSVIVEKIMTLIKFVDIKNLQTQFKIISLEHSSASYIADKINQLIISKKTQIDNSAFKVIAFDHLNSVGIVGNPQKITELKSIIKSMDLAQKDSTTPTSIKVRTLDYVNSKKISTSILSLLAAKKKSNTSSNFKIVAHEDTNSIVYTGNKADLDTVDYLIAKLDKPRKQVLIQLNILEINANHKFTMSSSMIAGASGKNDILTTWEPGSISGLATANATESIQNISSDSESSLANAFSSDFTIAAIANTGVNVLGLGTLSPGALINFIKTNDETRVISSPYLLTLNHEEAHLVVGQQFLYSSFDKKTNNQKIIKEPIELNLTITPNINTGENVVLDIELETSDIARITKDLPQINKRKTKQKLSVKNKQTSIIAGLSSNAESEIINGVPFLSKIPLIGRLFTNKVEMTNLKQIVIFLTPYIIDKDTDLSSIYKEKNEPFSKFLIKSQN